MLTNVISDYACPSLIEPNMESKLIMDNDSYTYPPIIDSTVRYNCNAGGPFNRRVDNYELYSYELTCMEDNVFSRSEWPTCINSKYSTVTLISNIPS